MKRLAPAETIELTPLSPIVWRSEGYDPGFVFDIDRAGGTFVCFALKIRPGGDGPKISFDQGDGFTEASALSLKTFPFAFYHLPLDRIPDGARVMFRPCTRPETFHFVAFQMSQPIVVAVLHYLFNLRYQNIGIFGPATKADLSRWEALKANAVRITRFFGDVSKGKGLRVQEGSETVAKLKLALSLQAAEVQQRMDAALVASDGPLLSFVAPTYNTRPDYLRDLVDSFLAQKAAYAELILTDDGSKKPETLAYLDQVATRPGVRVIRNPTNRGIAASTNTGMAEARGRWIALIDHDDVFVAGSIAIIADAIARCQDALFFYTDELIVDGSLKPIGAFCKPAYDSVLLSGANYINHFSVYRRDRLAEIGWLREDREGSQDYDLLLRYLAGIPVGGIVHIPFLAYMWRREEASYSHVNLHSSVASARRALDAAFAARGRDISVDPALDPSFHRIRFKAEGPPPLVSIVIPNRDSPALIQRIVADIFERTDYAPVEIVIVDNGTKDGETLAFYASLAPDARVTVYILEEPFNFARMCNRGARLAKGETILFLNNDIEVTEAGWLAEMVDCLSFASTGIVGAKLLYPSGLVQHNGVIVGLGNAAGHWYVERAESDAGPMGRFLVRQTLSAVTGACMLVSRGCFEQLGGFDEENFAISYNDIDFCMRARAVGIRTVWTPFARLIHHESLSRGSDEEGERNVRFKQEMARLQARHGTQTLVDDAYSPFYDRRESTPHIIVPETLPPLRPNLLP